MLSAIIRCSHDLLVIRNVITSLNLLYMMRNSNCRILIKTTLGHPHNDC